MGPLGTEGTFTDAAETTLRVLRNNSIGLLTILSAIVSDPLYKWTVNGAEASRKQAATHATNRIREKLKGYEDGTHGEQQSVESQVQLLINEARDHDNLCQMFSGWAPYL